MKKGWIAFDGSEYYEARKLARGPNPKVFLTSANASKRGTPVPVNVCKNGEIHIDKTRITK
jgi:hypothetical protein